MRRMMMKGLILERRMMR
jgi:hypothetical protein